MPDEPVESETFDFDKAFESLEEFEVDDENLEDLMEDAESHEWCLTEGNADFEGNMSRSLRRYLDSTLEEG